MYQNDCISPGKVPVNSEVLCLSMYFYADTYFMVIVQHVAKMATQRNAN